MTLLTRDALTWLLVMLASAPALARSTSVDVFAVPLDARPAALVQSVVVQPGEVDSLTIERVLSVSDDGRRAILVISDERLDAWPALFSFWPEAVVACLIVTGLLLARRARRLRRTAPGVPYCGTCGYTISGEPSRCSECGTALTRKTIRFGRRAWIPIGLSAAISIVVVIIYPLGQRMLPRESAWVWEHGRCYSRPLFKLIEPHFPEWVQDYCVTAESVIEFDTTTRRVVQVLNTARWHIDDAMRAPRGSGLLAMVADEGRLVVVDANAPAGSRVVYGAGLDTGPELIGFSADARRLFYYDTDSDIQSVCALDLQNSSVTRLQSLPCYRGGCFGPSGPYFEMASTSDLAVVDDTAANRSGEATLRLLDLASNEWIATLDRTGDYWRFRFTSDGSAIIAIDGRAELPRTDEPGDRMLLTYWPLSDLRSPLHVVIPFDDDFDELVEFDAAGPRSWRFVASRSMGCGDRLVLARHLDVAEDGSVHVVDQHRILSRPTGRDQASWSEGELVMNEGLIEWRASDENSWGESLLVYDLDLPPLQ